MQEKLEKGMKATFNKRNFDDSSTFDGIFRSDHRYYMKQYVNTFALHILALVKNDLSTLNFDS